MKSKKSLGAGKAGALPQPAIPERLYSPRSQKRIVAGWQKARELKNCKVQIECWLCRLAVAKEGEKRQASQIAAGNGYAHSILQAYVKESTEAAEMVAAFRAQAAAIQTAIDDLIPNAVEADERRRNQESMAAHLEARILKAKQLDGALQEVRRIASECVELTREMTRLAGLLEFPFGVNLGISQFEDLLRRLPNEMASEAERFATWFLGAEKDRSPYPIRNEEIVLPETLASAGAFTYGDCPELTRKEARQVEALVAARYPLTPEQLEMQAASRRPGEETKELPVGKIQWGLLRP